MAKREFKLEDLDKAIHDVFKDYEDYVTYCTDGVVIKGADGHMMLISYDTYNILKENYGKE